MEGAECLGSVPWFKLDLSSHSPHNRRPVLSEWAFFPSVKWERKPHRGVATRRKRPLPGSGTGSLLIKKRLLESVVFVSMCLN